MSSGEGITQSLQRRTRRQKRSQAATLVLMGATPFVVLGLDPLHTEVRVFEDVEACKKELDWNAPFCERLNEESLRRHASMAPRYDTVEACETEFAHVKDTEACEHGWCEQADVSVCEVAGDGYYRPQFSSFLVSHDVLEVSWGDRAIDVAELDEKSLQPVYTMPEQALEEDSSSHHYGSPFLWYYMTSRGSYLGQQGLRGPVTVARTSLKPGVGQIHSGRSTRGGFGTTARQTMQSARS